MDICCFKYQLGPIHTCLFHSFALKISNQLDLTASSPKLLLVTTTLCIWGLRQTFALLRYNKSRLCLVIFRVKLRYGDNCPCANKQLLCAYTSNWYVNDLRALGCTKSYFMHTDEFGPVVTGRKHPFHGFSVFLLPSLKAFRQL